MKTSPQIKVTVQFSYSYALCDAQKGEPSCGTSTAVSWGFHSENASRNSICWIVIWKNKIVTVYPVNTFFFNVAHCGEKYQRKFIKNAWQRKFIKCLIKVCINCCSKRHLLWMGVYKVETASRLCGKADQQSRKNVENFLKKRWKLWGKSGWQKRRLII